MTSKHSVTAAICVGTVTLITLLSGFSCRPGDASRGLPTRGPTGMNIEVPEPGLYGKTDDEAELGRRAIWGLVPSAWQPVGEHIVIVSRQSGDIIAAEQRDKYAFVGAASVNPFTLAGFTSFIGNDSGNPAQPTTIYLARGIWGDTGSIAHFALHEYGHTRYYSALMPPPLQTRWQGVWREAKARRSLPSGYAGVNEFEGFAESFAAYCAKQRLDGQVKAFFDALPR